MDDPRDAAIAKVVAEQVTAQLAAAFGPRHDLIAQRLNLLEQRIDALEDHLENLGHLGIEIQRGATHTQMLAQHLWSEFMGGTSTPQPPQPPQPMQQAPRPKAIDEACAVPPGEPPKVVRLPRYGATLIPEPGADPKTVWANEIKSLNNNPEGSTRGLRGSRRTRGH